MRILHARFENFRLLRDLELDFSTDPDRRLTVIRAENESGKTTILTGLQWGLYGDDALPGDARDFRLHPIDWDGTDGEAITISVEVDFEVVSARSGRADMYRIVRMANESVSGTTWKRIPFAIKLFRLQDANSEPMPYPEAQVKRELPPELREVFFTDGDRALSFIEADTRDKRERVQSAIRSLLGLDIIKDSLRHVHQASVSVNRQAKRIGSGSELQTVTSRLDEITDRSVQLEEEISDAQKQFNALSEKIDEVRKSIDVALVKGDKEQLQREYQTVANQLEQTDTQIQEAANEHAQLFRSFALSRDLLASLLTHSMSQLNELREQGKFPKVAVPILEERLSVTTCICGESLAGQDPQGHRRREHIEHLIEQSRKSDELQSRLTDLYYASVQFQPDQAAGEDSWVSEYAGISARRMQLGQERALKRQRDKLLREQEKGARILAELNVIQDVESVLKNSYERITNEELAKVSDLMNSFFLEMIGSDPEQGAIIQRAEISPEFDILVYGPKDRMLNPDRDLNGASRRALTLAFVLALTKVSGVEAPNVIDTPLGMMSGYVKRSVLRTTIRESHQPVLFLTRSEIADCEEILDSAAGRIFTLTNPAHYPLMLKNKHQVPGGTILRCECDHRRECPICERHLDPDDGMDPAA